MAVSDLAGAIGDSLLKGNNNSGLASPIFSYPGSYQGPFTGGQTTSTSPSVLAATTGPTAEQVAAQAAAQKAAQQAAQVAAINGGYDQIFKVYDQQLADIPGQIAENGQLINNQYNTGKSGIDTSYATGNANLQYARDSLGTQTKRSLSKLAQSIRQSFDSYSTLIGANGAGDSSATGQLSYALQKAQAQNRSDIFQNEQDNMTQIGLKQNELDANRAQSLKELDTWKSNAVIQIGQQFRQIQQQIEAARAGANQQRLSQLSALSVDAVNQAVAALSGVEAQHAATLNAIKSATSALSAPAANPALATTSYTPTAAPAAQVPALTAGGGQTASDSFVSVPYYKRLATGAA